MTDDFEEILEALIHIHVWRHWEKKMPEAHRVAFLKVDNELRERLWCYMN